MIDPFSRTIDYLRISITDRCNEHCLYCLPEGFSDWMPRAEILRYEEIMAVAETAAALGVRKFRITGGEPLVRKDAVSFIRDLAARPDIPEVALSTNGTRLAPVAEELARAGVRSVNVSLDALDPAIYRQITGSDLADVLLGLAAARDAGIPQIKLNAVLMRGINESQILPLAEFAAAEGYLLRFIELMPVSLSARLTEKNFFPIAEARRLLETRSRLVPSLARHGHGPAIYHEMPDLGATVGFIGALTNHQFCESCNKMRLTADGMIRPCLGQHGEVDLKPALRPQIDRALLRDRLLIALHAKPLAHAFREAYEPGRIMTAIGG